MSKQDGFINLDTSALLVYLMIIAAIFGYGAAHVIPWIWSLIKPFIHTMTA